MLEQATNSFSEKRFLGVGAFGRVYKGLLPAPHIHGDGYDGDITVAVKRLNGETCQGTEEMLHEISVLGTLHHGSLVQLYGYCLEGREALLVYEFVNMGSLDCHLFRNDGIMNLPWRTRLRIATSAASGLAFLHTRGVVHRDFKPANILINTEFEAKIADFGLAKVLGERMETITTRIMGTDGYLDPCYMQTGQVNEKSDVYSFGVFLLELLTGLRAVNRDVRPPRILLATVDEHLVKQARPIAASFMDTRLNGAYDAGAAVAVSNEAKRCIRSNRSQRPEMSDVHQRLAELLANSN